MYPFVTLMCRNAVTFKSISMNYPSSHQIRSDQIRQCTDRIKSLVSSFLSRWITPSMETIVLSYYNLACLFFFLINQVQFMRFTSSFKVSTRREGSGKWKWKWREEINVTITIPPLSIYFLFCSEQRYIVYVWGDRRGHAVRSCDVWWLRSIVEYMTSIICLVRS